MLMDSKQIARTSSTNTGTGETTLEEEQELRTVTFKAQ